MCTSCLLLHLLFLFLLLLLLLFLLLLLPFACSRSSSSHLGCRRSGPAGPRAPTGIFIETGGIRAEETTRALGELFDVPSRNRVEPSRCRSFLHSPKFGNYRCVYAVMIYSRSCKRRINGDANQAPEKFDKTVRQNNAIQRIYIFVRNILELSILIHPSQRFQMY